ncbi:MAG: cytochrome c biogenesis protein CcdA, partial [Acidimicrobiia bacterium]
LPTFQRAPKDRTLGAMFLFGVSYATVSLSCTLPTFIGPVAASLRGSFASGVAVFLAYSAGMGVILMSLTLSLGLARGSLVRHFRRALPYVGRVSGVLLILAGAYVAYYGWVEYEVVIQGRTVSAGPVDWVTEQADSIVRWITEMGEHRVGLVLASTLAVAAGAVFLRSRSRRRLA